MLKSLILIIISTVLIGQSNRADAIALKQLADKSRVMELAESLSLIGPRLTGTPQFNASVDWTISTLKKMGLTNIHKDSWGPFGRGWTLERFWMNAVGPANFPVLAYPQAWSSSTNGLVNAEAILFDSKDKNYKSTYGGKLAGKMVLMDKIRPLKPRFKPLAKRRTDEELKKLSEAEPVKYSGKFELPDFLLKQFKRDQEIFNFLLKEKPAAILFAGFVGGERGIVFPGNANVYQEDLSDPYYFLKGINAFDLKAGYIVPQILVSVEHYNRLYRQVHSGQSVQIEMELNATYHQENMMSDNVIAEIAGSDLKDEVVMLGGHLDTYHAGTGATDNGAGVVIAMEAMRVLKQYYQTLGKKPRRTIRLALWSGEEQDLLGSTAYVKKHLADMEGGSYNLKMVKAKKDHEKISAYYNLDHGAGKIRGIRLTGFTETIPLFKQWIKPLQDLGVSTVSAAGLPGGSGSDHMPFVAAGIPGFMFIQDQLEYNSLTHHSVMDELDHLIQGDLKQAVAVLSYFVFKTAENETKISRN